MDEKKEIEEKTEELPVVEDVHMTRIDVDEDKEEHKELFVGIKTEDSKKKEQENTNNRAPKKKTNKIMYVICIAIVCLICIGAFLFYQYQQDKKARQNAYDKVYEQLKVTFKENQKDEEGNTVDVTMFEYGTQDNDPLELVDTHYGDLTCSPTVIDTMKIGTQRITYTVSLKDSYNQLVSREFTLEVKVNDTNSPIVTIKENQITITEGDTFDPLTNIESVKDSVDGNLEYVEQEKEKENESAPFYEKGWYTYTTDMDVNTPGTYYIRIEACDKNGNATDVSYQVRVKKKDPTTFEELANQTYTQALSQLTSSDTQTVHEQRNWENLNQYLGTVLYQSEQFSSQKAMEEAANAYIEENFETLTKDKPHESRPIIGSISIDTVSATLHYMQAIDEDGNVMYYFFSIT